MSGWTEREFGSVKLIHHSTSSLIEMLVTKDEGVEQFWFDYYQFSDLKKVLEIAD